MKIIKIISFFFLLHSCNNKKFESVLTSREGKYWDVILDGQRKFDSPAYCYFFSPDGRCNYYFYRKVTGPKERVIFNFGDVYYPKAWKYSNDTLFILGVSYFIQKFSIDTIVLENTHRRDELLILIPSSTS